VTPAATREQWRPRRGEGIAANVAVSGLVAVSGDLAPGESTTDRVFATVRAALDSAGVERKDCDSVVLAADDVADGRSITTMLQATAAGAYRKDEVRVTNGALTALGLAALRVAAAAARRSIVASWWHPSVGASELGRASIDVRHGSSALVPPQLLGLERMSGGCAACVVGPPGDGGALRLAGVSFGQADYDAWIGRDGEPAGMLRQLGRDLARRWGPFGPDTRVAASLTAEPDDWLAAEVAAGIGDAERLRPAAAHHGIADGLVVLSRLAAALEPGAGGVAFATGLPLFMSAEGAAIWRGDA
jgi:hypothetical protein